MPQLVLNSKDARLCVQMNKAQYKELDCAKELKRGNIASFFSPSPKKKLKREEDSENAAATTTATVTKAEPHIKNEPLASVKPEAIVKPEVAAHGDHETKEEPKGGAQIPVHSAE